MPRSSDEPGKGMKWCIVPENRAEMEKSSKAAKGHRNSSVPRSPGTFSNVDPDEANGVELLASIQRARKSPRKSPVAQSPILPYGSAAQFTPDRGAQLPTNAPYRNTVDGSPLPRRRRGPAGLSDNVQGSPPTLSSSYLPEEGNSLVTPAPLRVHPQLAPPSTAQRPSQHMPTSSPAPFWKYADFGNTPASRFGLGYDMSPSKAPEPAPGSSSPAPRSGGEVTSSPTRKGTTLKQEIPDEDDLDEEPAVDLLGYVEFLICGECDGMD